MILLPWVVAPHLGDGRDRHRSSIDTDAAIESVSTLELVTADRPTVSPSAKRSDGFRIPSIMPAGALAEDPGSSFAWSAWSSGSVGWAEPIALHLAHRGPPQVTGA
jgi:hypothetical protein